MSAGHVCAEIVSRLEMVSWESRGQPERRWLSDRLCFLVTGSNDVSESSDVETRLSPGSGGRTRRTLKDVLASVVGSLSAAATQVVMEISSLLPCWP